MGPRGRVQWDWTFSVGTLINLVLLFTAAASVWVALVRRIDRLELQVKMMWRVYAHRFDLPSDLNDPLNGMRP